MRNWRLSCEKRVRRHSLFFDQSFIVYFVHFASIIIGMIVIFYN